MADFESGVFGYVTGEATVTVNFPVDKRGVADVSCNQCDYFRRNYRKCGINGAICEYPDKYVGSRCPLHIKNIDTEKEINND